MAAGGSAPDLLLLNGRISTMSALGEVEALAVKDGRIVSSGTSASLGALAGPSTRVVDLRRRRVIPGLIDAHCHPVKGAIAGMFACKFAFSATPDDISDALDAFFAKWPAVECVMGGRYGSDFLDKFGAEIGRPRDWLDARSRGRAVYLREDSGHNGWANSAALKMLGITRDSPDPKGGKIVRDETGEPTGILLEEADVAARLAWPDWSHEQYKEGILEMQKIAHSFGITGVIDADTNHAMLKAFKEVDSEGALSLKVAACLTTPYGHREEPLDYEHYERWRDEYAGKNVDTRFVKVNLVGPNFSSKLLLTLLENDYLQTSLCRS